MRKLNLICRVSVRPALLIFIRYVPRCRLLWCVNLSCRCLPSDLQSCAALYCHLLWKFCPMWFWFYLICLVILCHEFISYIVCIWATASSYWVFILQNCTMALYHMLCSSMPQLHPICIVDIGHQFISLAVVYADLRLSIQFFLHRVG